MVEEERHLLKLGEYVRVWRVLPYHVPGKKEYFSVDWPSYWDDELAIEVGVAAVRKRNGRWKVVKLELPENVPEEDIEDIISCHWYVFDKNDTRRKSPPVVMAWDFVSPPVWVAACERPTQEKQIPFAQRIKEIDEDIEVRWEGLNLLDILHGSGPGICTTVTADDGVFEFDILKTGVFAVRSFCPGCQGKPGKENDEEIAQGFLDALTRSPGAAVTVRTFTDETVCIESDGELVRVPVKEIRGFIVRVLPQKNSRVVLACEKLPPEAVRESYCYDAQTGKYTGLIVNERDHRFV